MVDANPMFDLRGMSRTYTGDGPPVTALEPTNLSIQHGTFTAVLGPSGAGKSTLLNLLGMLDRPSSGHLRVDGLDTAELNQRDFSDFRASRIGFVFQEFHLVRGRDVLDNVELGLMYTGTRKRKRQAQAAEVVTRVGLAHRMRADVRTLSGGERQRVAIARAIATGATALLCDEPTGNLDQQTGDDVLALLRWLQDAGTTIVVVSHDTKVTASAEHLVRVTDGNALPGGAALAGAR